MEAFAITVLSIFALFGLFSAKSCLLGMIRSKTANKGVKLILCLPHGISPQLEGIVRRIFSENTPEALMTDGKLYIMAPADDMEAAKLLELLERQFPLEVLPDPVSYCMIQEKDNQK